MIRYILVFILVWPLTLTAADLTQGDTIISLSGSRVLTSGLNPTTHEPLPGSDWIVMYSNVYAGNCNQFVGTPYIHDDGDENIILNDYLDPSTTDCSTASDPSDPDHIVVWSDMGLSQNEIYGIDILACGYGKSCGITQDIKTADKSLTTITPTKGIDGTAPGKGDVFATSIKNGSYSNSIGYGGVGGLADLPTMADTTKYCLILRDYSTDGAASEYAKNPFLDMWIYTWNPIIQGPTAAPGLTPPSETKIIHVYEGLDNSILYWLRQDHIINVSD